VRTLVLDSGAFIAAEAFDRRIGAIVQAAADTGADVIVPATVIAETWRTPARANSAALLKSASSVWPLDDRGARAVGDLLTRDRSVQIVDANVVTIAIATKPSLVVTSDPTDIQRLVKAAGETCSLGTFSGTPPSVLITVV